MLALNSVYNLYFLSKYREKHLCPHLSFSFEISISRVTGAKVDYLFKILIHLAKLLFKKVVPISIPTITLDSFKTASVGFLNKYHPQSCQGTGNHPLVRYRWTRPPTSAPSLKVGICLCPREIPQIDVCY